jgi:aconitate hydratase
VAVLSGNRNFEGRIHPRVKASYLMSPALVRLRTGRQHARQPRRAPIARRRRRAVLLRELWPRAAEVDSLPLARQPARFNAIYARAG